jgi:hypothetical protein
MMTSRYKDRLAKLAVHAMALGDRFPRGSKYAGRTVEVAVYDNPQYVVFCSENKLYTFEQSVLDLAYEQLNKERGA